MGAVIVTGIAAGAVYGLFALGLVLIYKASRVLNFAQAEIGTFATFLVWTLAAPLHVPWLAALLVGLLGAAAIGLAFERTVVRPLIDAPRLTLVVATVALGLLLAGIEAQTWSINPKILPEPIHAMGPRVAGFVLAPPRLMALGITTFVGLASTWFFRRTTFGLALLAAAQDIVSVRLTGIRLRHLSAFTWGVSSVIGGIAGVIIALSLGGFAPFFMARIMLLGFAAAVVGGMTSLPGALIGGLAVGLAEAVISRFWISIPGLVETLMFGAIVLMLLFRPRGLLGRDA